MRKKVKDQTVWRQKDPNAVFENIPQGTEFVDPVVVPVLNIATCQMESQVVLDIPKGDIKSMSVSLEWFIENYEQVSERGAE